MFAGFCPPLRHLTEYLWVVDTMRPFVEFEKHRTTFFKAFSGILKFQTTN